MGTTAVRVMTKLINDDHDDRALQKAPEPERESVLRIPLKASCKILLQKHRLRRSQAVGL